MNKLSSLLSFDGRVVVIAGGAGGIGSAIVHRFNEAGATTIVVDLPDATPPEGVAFFPCDIGDPESVAVLIRTIQEQFGRIDVLVHVAGIARDAMLWKLTVENWSHVMRVNLDSAFHLLHAAAPVMRHTRGGSVILVTSINGERGKAGQSNYAASKAGLIGLGRTAARELGPSGIRVNMIAPGMIRTAMTETLSDDILARATEEAALRRTGEPDDVAGVALFLASDLSRHITGQVIRVDGGQLIG